MKAPEIFLPIVVLIAGAAAFSVVRLRSQAGEKRRLANNPEQRLSS